MRERFLNWVIAHPWLVIVAIAIVILSSLAGIPRLGFTSDFRMYFGPENPQLKAFEEMEQRFSRQDNVFFLVSTPSSQTDQTLFQQDALALIEALTTAGWKLPYSQRVDSLQNFQYTQVDGDDLLIAEFYTLDELPLDLSALAQRAMNDPDIVPKILSKDGRTTGINVQLFLPENNSAAASLETVKAARALANSLRQQYPDFSIEVAGSVTSNVTMGEAIKQDIESLLVISYVIMLAIMLLLLRTVTGMLLVTAVIGMSVIVTMGVFGWLSYTLTPPTGFVPTAIMTIAVADTIHILVSYYYYLRQGNDKKSALMTSLSINFSPVFITSITTMIGVLCLNTSDSPPYRDMGNMIAVGVLVAWLLTITFLPAVLALLPTPKGRSSQQQSALMDRLADTIIHHHKALFIAMVALVAASATFAGRNTITERWHEFFDTSFEVRRTIDHIEKSLGGLHVLYFVTDSERDNGINDVEFLQQLDDLVQWLHQQPGVVQVTSISDTLKRLNQNLHGDDPAWYRTPESNEAAAQYLLLYELSLPLGLGLDNTLTSDRSATRIQVSLERSDSRHILAMEKDIVAWSEAHAPLLHIREATGLDIVFANLTFRNVTAMLEGTGFALIIISLLMIAALRSWRLGLISMVPNMFPAILAYGLWGLLYGKVDTATSVVACVSLGIVVDDTVHFLSKYNYARLQLKHSPADAIRYAFHTVGVALLITSAILIGGFMVMEFSHFNPSRAMGTLLAITIAVALLIDFLLLPPLLLLTDKRQIVKTHKPESPLVV